MRSLCVSLSLALALPGVALAAPTEFPAAEGVYTATFAEDFFQEEDFQLDGIHSTRAITFTRPKAWLLTADPVVHVQFEHSAALLPERSHLTLSVNDHPIGTITLDASNVSTGSADIRVPRALLHDYNVLKFDVVQHYTNDCEDPFDAALWTRIRATSSLDLAYRRAPVEGELLAWPYPLVDKLAYGPTRVTLVTPGGPSRDTVEALGLLGFSLGRLADYRDVETGDPVATAAEATTPALVIGTAAEVPEALTLAGVESLGESEGLVALVPNPADPTLAVLVVSGGGPEGLRKAAQALAGQDRYQVLSGSVSRVSQIAPSQPPPTRQNPLPAPPATRFTLANLGMSGSTVNGYYSAMTRIPVRLEGDALAQPGGGTIRVDYAYSAQLDSRLSTMEIRLGGLTLRSVPLDKVAGEAQASVSVPLPQDILTPASNIDIVFHLFPRDYDECERVSDKQIWGTVYPTTAIDIARDHVAEMPDLARLRYGNWPFTAMPSGGGTVAVLPDNPDGRAESAGFALAARFGKLTTAPTPDFSLVRAVDVSFTDRADKHFVVLVDGSTNTLYDGLVAAQALSLTGGPDRLLANGKELLLNANVGTPYGTIEETISPANRARAVLVLRALREDGLGPLVEQMTDLGKVKSLEGNVAVLAGDTSVRTLDVASKQRWGTLPVATAATREIRRNWWVLGALVIGGVFLLTAIVRAFAQARSTERD
jgi:hypothetical protein